MKPKIAIINSSSFGNVFPEQLKQLKQFAEITRINVPIDISEKDFLKKLKGLHGIIASVNPDYRGTLLKKLPDLIVVSRHGIGVNNVDVRTATQLGIMVCKVPGIIEQEAMAEHTITLLLSASRQIQQASFAVKKGGWNQRAQFVGHELKNKNVGIIGIGNIGSRVAEILKKGFQSHVHAYDPFLHEKVIRKRNALSVEFQHLLKISDFIILLRPLNETTHHGIGPKEFVLMKKGVVIINPARGELIDEKALIKNLKSRKVGAYAADAVTGEPIGKNHPLLKLDNVLIVPHIGAYTYDSLRQMGEIMVDNMRDVFVEGKIPKTIVNRDIPRKRIRTWA